VSGFGDLLALAANVESVARAMRDLRSTVVALFDVNEGESSSLAVTYGDGLDYWDVLSESEYACLVACLVHAGRPAPMDVIDLRERAYEHDHDHDDEQHDQQGT
jgi:hypothetical protein